MLVYVGGFKKKFFCERAGRKNRERGNDGMVLRSVYVCDFPK